MGLTKKRLFVGCLVFAGVTFFGVVLAFVIWVNISLRENIRVDEERRIKALQSRTAETLGTITDFSETRGSKTATNRRIEFQFVVNGQTYTDSQYNDSFRRVESTYRKGMEGKVCYDPSNPQNAQFYSKIEKIVCGQ